MNTLQKIDPVKKQQEVDLESGLSPMDPPDAYAPPSKDAVKFEEMHPFLQELWNEHDDLSEELNSFESAIHEIEKEGITKEANIKLRNFFQIFDEKFLPHHSKEEKLLFPLLAERLKEKGEHSKGEETHTAVDMMEDEHVTSLQLAAAIFNIFALSTQLPDENSRLIALDTALQQGKQFVEMLRLHIFRENTIVFAQAHELITFFEFDDMKNNKAGI